ncbi:MAG TPA: iron transporter [Methylibium sp.]|uniref:iron transporter n=1 Tax=Methylibium sp. TaxID=2067992 RepID=UPI002DB67D76|nr:iron transporter [Methylibium sp.]HEU4457589.1 iron transporter [Methylibium sp.]
MSRATFAPADAALRTACAVVGGYALAWCFTACLARALPALFGMAASDAVMTASMLSFVVYLVVVVRVFALRSAPRAVAETLGLSAVFAALCALLPVPAAARLAA